MEYESGRSSATPTMENVIHFPFAKRPNTGTRGEVILLRANFFQINPRTDAIYSYDISMNPRDCPRHINRKLFEKMIKSCPEFKSEKFAFNGRHCMYSKSDMNLEKKSLKLEVALPDDELEVALPDSQKSCMFTVEIDFAESISMRSLLQSLQRGNMNEIHQSAIRALDTILRYHLTTIHTSVGRSFFSPPDETTATALGNGKEVWYGFYQNVVPCQWKPMLNLDVTASTFYKAQPVIEFLREVLGEQDIFFLDNNQLAKFAKEITGVKVQVTHCRRRKYRVCRVIRYSAHLQNFLLQMEDGTTVSKTVEEYFLEKYNYELRYPHLPCLQVEPESKKIYLPLEVCNIVGRQRFIKKLSESETSTMIKYTIRSASDREREINDLVRTNCYKQNEFLQAFDISVREKMEIVKGHVLPAPTLYYGLQRQNRRQKVVPSAGVWDMRGKQVHTGVTIIKWAVLSFCSSDACPPEAVNAFLDELKTISTNAGMCIIGGPCAFKYVHDKASLVETVFCSLMRSFSDLKLVLVILPGKTSVYAVLKKVGDTLLGVATQCVQKKNVIRFSPQTISNICLKINAKLGGINSILEPYNRIPEVFNKPVMFLGADLLHPFVNDNQNPAVAAVVGSMDAHPYKYEAVIRVQNRQQERIEDLSSMVKMLLMRFYTSTGFKPHKLIFYRQGVSVGQFQNVLNRELLGIRHTCLELEEEYKPGITYIMVERSHHTRLFCVDSKQQGKGGNIPAGTAIDTSITHPSEFDFYLASHSGMQGTNHPTHYFVLWDDNNFHANDVQGLTWQLCHTNARCTRSVSTPAPVFYAHLVTTRARIYPNEKTYDSECSSQHSDGEGSISFEKRVHIIHIHPNLRDSLFFA